MCTGPGSTGRVRDTRCSEKTLLLPPLLHFSPRPSYSSLLFAVLLLSHLTWCTSPPLLSGSAFLSIPPLPPLRLALSPIGVEKSDGLKSQRRSGDAFYREPSCLTAERFSPWLAPLSKFHPTLFDLTFSQLRRSLLLLFSPSPSSLPHLSPPSVSTYFYDTFPAGPSCPLLSPLSSPPSPCANPAEGLCFHFWTRDLSFAATVIHP